MSTIKSTTENLIEALACDHQARTHHDFRRYNDFRQHCSVCFYLKMAEEGCQELPGADVVVITRINKNINLKEDV